MGRLDGIMTTVRNQRRSAPLETREISTASGPLRVPTPAEILRIKAWLVVDRNATIAARRGVARQRRRHGHA